MSKKYFVTICSSQIINDQINDFKLTVPCKFNFKNNMGLISYEELVEKNKFFSTIKINKSGSIIISRKGVQSVKIILEKNKHNTCIYFAEFGNIQLGVFTHELICKMEKYKCDIELSYSLDVNNKLLSQNKVIITVREENNV